MKQTIILKKINFLEAESVALNRAYAEFFGENKPVGMGYTFLEDRENGNEWSDSEKAYAKYISEMAIRDLKRKNMTQIIESGLVPDCQLSRIFMATGNYWHSR